MIQREREYQSITYCGLSLVYECLRDIMLHMCMHAYDGVDVCAHDVYGTSRVITLESWHTSHDPCATCAHLQLRSLVSLLFGHLVWAGWTTPGVGSVHFGRWICMNMSQKRKPLKTHEKIGSIHSKNKVTVVFFNTCQILKFSCVLLISFLCCKSRLFPIDRACRFLCLRMSHWNINPFAERISNFGWLVGTYPIFWYCFGWMHLINCNLI